MKNRKLHLGCSNDELRPKFQYIFFDSEYAVCTNTEIIILEDRNNFKEIENLPERFLIHKSNYAQLTKDYKEAYYLEDSKLICIERNEHKRDYVRVLLPENTDFEFIEYKKVFDIQFENTISCIGFKVKNLKLALNILNFNNIKMEFFSCIKGVIITDTSKEDLTKCIVMPCILT